MRNEGGLQPYYNNLKAGEMLSNAVKPQSPAEYTAQPNALAAARSYLKDAYGEWAVRIFDHVLEESYRGIKITEELLPEIAKTMAARNSLAKDKLVTIVSEMTQLKNARLGKGDSVKGFLDSFGYHR